jgi:biotin carboxylase
MGNIVVVDPVSTGANFIYDIISRGHNPIALMTTIEEDSEEHLEFKKGVESDLNEIKYDFELIREQDSYEETLELVRDYDPMVVLPGSETGVILASKLAYDLDLKCNPIENLDAMTLKHEMQNRLAENNLRHIRGRVVKSRQEAIEFYREENLKEVVIKPIYSAASASVRICTNEEEMADSIDELFTKTNLYGDRNDVLLVQERINGQEYFVNTVSCDGVHRVTLIWKYSKVKTSEGAIIYDTIETVNELNLGEAEMVEYAYQVADAIGIKYGAVHGEYMIDEDGPVLIEVNCRPSGAHMDAEYLDRISGQHETDSILDSYLKPEHFHEERKKPYRPFAHGTVKLFIAPRDILAEAAPMTNISINLKSHYKTSIENKFLTKKLFFKTQDMVTSCGLVYMVHEDMFELHKDIEFLRKVESMAFDLVLSEERTEKMVIDEDECVDASLSLVSECEIYGTTLFVTDQKIDSACVQMTLDEIPECAGTYDCLVINLNKSIIDMKEDEIAKIFLDIFTRVRVGGLIFVPKTTYTCIRSGRRGMEALLKVLNLRIELPPQEISDVIVASKT